jgi:hypothetical protein
MSRNEAGKNNFSLTAVVRLSITDRKMLWENPLQKKVLVDTTNKRQGPHPILFLES